MVLIADAGSTKTECFYNGKTFFTQGINPIQQSEETIAAILEEAAEKVAATTPEQPLQIRFYGAGCTPEKAPILKRLLAKAFLPSVPNEPPVPALSMGGSIEVHSDLLAAAHSLLGHNPGIACILGTGSNSCLYDGERIIQNTPALGYILGDEGSGAVLGRLFVNALLKGRIEKDIAENFNLFISELTEQKTTTKTELAAVIIDRVYRQPLANRFLASLSMFIGRYKENPAVCAIISQNFADFLDHNIKPYFEAPESRVQSPELSFTGSIAYHYADILRETVAKKGYSVKQITKSPMEGLLKFYSKIPHFPTLR